jgi:hypothetical protein
MRIKNYMQLRTLSDNEISCWAKTLRLGVSITEKSGILNRTFYVFQSRTSTVLG